MYHENKRCTHCERFISMEGVYKSPVRHTPYSGRKSLEGLYVGPAHKITVEQC
jgi:hypothetical protein